MELRLGTREVAGYTVVEVRGEVDVYTASVLREKLVEVIDRGAGNVVPGGRRLNVSAWQGGRSNGWHPPSSTTIFAWPPARRRPDRLSE